jgi:hypothetical protein
MQRDDRHNVSLLSLICSLFICLKNEKGAADVLCSLVQRDSTHSMCGIVHKRKAPRGLKLLLHGSNMNYFFKLELLFQDFYRWIKACYTTIDTVSHFGRFHRRKECAYGVVTRTLPPDVGWWFSKGSLCRSTPLGLLDYDNHTSIKTGYCLLPIILCRIL